MKVSISNGILRCNLQMRHARRRMLQTPLKSLGTGNRSRGNSSIFLLEKQDRVRYSIMQTRLNQWTKFETVEPPLPLTKETMNGLLKIAEPDAERKCLKYAVVRATDLTQRQNNSMGLVILAPLCRKYSKHKMNCQPSMERLRRLLR